MERAAPQITTKWQDMGSVIIDPSLAEKLTEVP
jgi:hypothetical protein